MARLKDRVQNAPPSFENQPVQNKRHTFSSSREKQRYLGIEAERQRPLVTACRKSPPAASFRFTPSAYCLANIGALCAAAHSPCICSRLQIALGLRPNNSPQSWRFPPMPGRRGVSVPGTNIFKHLAEKAAVGGLRPPTKELLFWGSSPLAHRARRKKGKRNALAMRFMFCTAAVRKDCSYMLRLPSMRA